MSKIKKFFQEYFYGFFFIVLGIVMIFGLWAYRIAPRWNDFEKYSDRLYNTMWNLTGVGVGVGFLLFFLGFYLIKSKSSK